MSAKAVEGYKTKVLRRLKVILQEILSFLFIKIKISTRGCMMLITS